MKYFTIEKNDEAESGYYLTIYFDNYRFHSTKSYEITLEGASSISNFALRLGYEYNSINEIDDVCILDEKVIRFLEAYSILSQLNVNIVCRVSTISDVINSYDDAEGYTQEEIDEMIKQDNPQTHYPRLK